jgi:hypothetical protein
VIGQSNIPIIKIKINFSKITLEAYSVLLNLSMKCGNSAFNAQGSRLIIAVVDF